jgi:hypothetical protein
MAPPDLRIAWVYLGLTGASRHSARRLPGPDTLQSKDGASTLAVASKGERWE